MQDRKQFSCFIIGEGTLPIQCAEVLLQREHKLCGIISSDVLIQRWANETKTPQIEPAGDLVAFVSQRPFDYLFSIVNNRIIPQEVLDLPGNCAINYHDAPLPKYAGSHATSWAIMNRETGHAVTWHVMSKRVDGGDILRQCPVTISDRDSALTLNAKCYEAAIRSFAELIDELSCGRVSAIRQNLAERTFFPRYKRPPAGCVLSWNRSAEDIDAFIRALDFGPYPNPIGLPKLAVGGRFVIVGGIEVLDCASETPAGTVTKIDRSSLQISTTSHDIKLHELLTIEGQPLSIPDFVARLGLHEGHRFKNIDPESAQRITEFDARICKHETFWVKRLMTLPHPIAPPSSIPNGSHGKAARYLGVALRMPEEVTLFLEGRPLTWRTGEFLFAVFVVYLARVGGVCRFDIRFRDLELQRDVTGLEGIFARHVPLQVDLDYAQSFVEVFDVVKEQVELGRQHKTYARDLVVRSPTLRLTPQRWRKQALPVIVELVETLEGYQAVPGSEFTLLITQDGRECRWVYDAQIFDSDCMAGMRRQFTALLQDIAKNHDRHIGDLLLLTQEERQQVLVEFNNTDLDYPRTECIHQLFEAQVKRTPNAVAVVSGDEKLTYRELNCRANQVAHHLQALGVGPEVLVGICMQRSLRMVVGLLGILKAGAAYVSLDPSYPLERSAFILDDTRARVLVTERQLSECPCRHTARVIYLDTDWALIGQESEADLETGVTANNLAYIIYTSGSTGKPKGVAIEHRSAIALLSWAKTVFPLEDLDGVLASTSICFDLSVFELFCPLTCGGRVILVRDTLELPNLPPEVGVTLVNTVPSAIAELLRVDRGLPLSLRTINLAGEPLSNGLVQQLYERKNIQRVFDLYGPSEDTTYSTFALRKSTGPATIGRPISNTRIYILDAHLQPVPLGVPGELHIGGDGLARGYLNRPEQTAEKFIPDPFGNNPGARLYRTGDLVRYLPDGNIEFLGRLDHQVKIRGFRIECGEVETILGSHPAVREAVVVAREVNTADKRLVAYVVLRQKQAVTSGNLRTFLKQKLPDFMVPSVFVTLESLPLTTNGKVDRRALPEVDPSKFKSDRAYVSPQNELENAIVKIWQKVLNVEQIGTHDNFFDLGGHSLLMVQVNQQLREITGRNIPIVEMFRYPTVCTLARSLGQSSDGEQSLRQSASRGQARRDSMMRRRQPRQSTQPDNSCRPGATR